jgi:hypothetical protein
MQGVDLLETLDFPLGREISSQISLQNYEAE